MKYQDYGKLSVLVQQKRELEGKIKSAEGKGLGVAIEGRYHDELADYVRDSIIQKLHRDCDDINREIEKLGVTL